LLNCPEQFFMWLQLAVMQIKEACYRVEEQAF